ncbi:hypothetical protein IU450_09165 [Nocardia abscessus]|uniref:hypothetical protein n=1 Tax=Nocardia abscessus TaxID=120957 RepID=UPI0018948DD0|nr:hypothetical protein [Nocardia abscessus]MBF6336052.1 hypothetical protein [Nocardia abscessus]
MRLFRRHRRRPTRIPREIAGEFGEEAVVQYVVPGVFRVLRAVASGVARTLE